MNGARAPMEIGRQDSAAWRRAARRDLPGKGERSAPDRSWLTPIVAITVRGRRLSLPATLDPMAASHLHRFHTAQDAADSGYTNALAEIRGTGKRTHWIWYIFPQLAGLGRSPVARRYGIAGR